MAPSFSLISPVLNGENYIARSYWCLRNQGVDDWEWIIVDDGSTDQTVHEVEKLGDERIKLIRLDKNKGRGYARTVALNEACGSWIVVWDIDDIYFPDRLTQALIAKEQGKDFCVSWCIIIDKVFNITGYRRFGLFDDRKTKSFLHPTLSCESSILKKLGYDPTSTAGEDFFAIYSLSKEKDGFWSDDPIIAYREDSNPNKAKEAILSKVNQIKTLQQIAASDGLTFDIKKTIWKVRIKKWLLSMFLIYPPAYKWTFSSRSHDSSKVGAILSKSKLDYIGEAKRRLLAESVVMKQHVVRFENYQHVLLFQG